MSHTPRPLPHYSARALGLWPGLDRSRLTRTQGDPAKIARLVMRRTTLPFDNIVRVLTKDQGSAS